MVEIEIGILWEQRLDRCIPDADTLRAEIEAWEAGPMNSKQRSIGSSRFRMPEPGSSGFTLTYYNRNGEILVEEVMPGQKRL